jgi:hypothetical protein
MLMSYLSYKAERAGRRVVKVDPRNASKTLVRGGDCPESLWTGNLCYTTTLRRECIVSFLEEAGNPHREVRMPRPRGRGSSLFYRIVKKSF